MVDNQAGLAEALLEAHVQHIVEELSSPGLKALLAEEVDAVLLLAGKLTVGNMVTRKQIKDTAAVFASEVEFGPGLPELVGEIARRVYGHEIHDKTTPGDLLTDQHFEDFTDQILELDSLRDKIIRAAVTSPLYADFASDLLYSGITGYLAQSNVAKNIPGASSMLKLGRAALSVATPKLEASLEEGLRKYIAKAVQASTTRSAEFLISHARPKLLKELALDTWEKLRDQPVGGLREHVGETAVEELFVTGFEAWHHLRKQDWYRIVIDAGIDGFFEKYQDATLATLLADLGIDRERIVDELQRYAPSVIKTLKKKKLLEPIARRRLAGFYGSKAFADIVGRH
ncbi:MAG: hypothetical protein Q8M37_01850 [Nevskia sp.]|nr:hypothetical protein [Nevskia sp.]